MVIAFILFVKQIQYKTFELLVSSFAKFYASQKTIDVFNQFILQVFYLFL
jgi:hypothetical protein